MTFLDSFINNKDDIEQQYQSEKNSLNFYFIKNFNKRRCNCCRCSSQDDDYDYEYMKAHEKKYGNIGNEYYCIQEDWLINYYDPDDIPVVCECTCLYPPTNKNPLILSELNIEAIIRFLQSKNVKLDNTFDFIETDDKKTILDDTPWNNIIINIYKLTNDDIIQIIQEYNKMKLINFAKAYDFLSIINDSSRQSLKFTS